MVHESNIVEKYNIATKHVKRGKRLSLIYFFASGVFAIYEFFVKNLSYMLILFFIMISSLIGFFILYGIERKLRTRFNMPDELLEG